MTDNEIIRCLRHCRAGDCENCKALNVCDATFSFHKEALDLINRQKAIIEKSEKVEHFADKTIETANAEIERLNIELQSMRSAANSYKVHYESAKPIDINEIKSEAIKEFAKELKNCFAISGDYLDIINIIDNLVKEMTEKKNDFIKKRSV